MRLMHCQQGRPMDPPATDGYQQCSM